MRERDSVRDEGVREIEWGSENKPGLCQSSRGNGACAVRSKGQGHWMGGAQSKQPGPVKHVNRPLGRAPFAQLTKTRALTTTKIDSTIKHVILNFLREQI